MVSWCHVKLVLKSCDSALVTVTPHTQCRLKLLKLERIKDYLLMEEEFIRNQEQMKPLEEKQEVSFEWSVTSNVTVNALNLCELLHIRAVEIKYQQCASWCKHIRFINFLINWLNCFRPSSDHYRSSHGSFLFLNAQSTAYRYPSREKEDSSFSHPH